MNSKGIKGIVVAQLFFEDSNGKVANYTAYKADDNGWERGHEASGRRNGYQAGNTAGGGTQDGRLSTDPPFSNYPGKGCSGSCGLGGNKGIGSQLIGTKGTARIKAEPAKPEKGCTENGHWKIVRNHGSTAIAGTLAKENTKSEAGYTGENVNYQTSCKVKGTKLGQEATAPYPVSHWVVNKDGPKENKESEGCELHAFSKGTCNKSRGNNGKHALEGNEGQLRNGAIFKDIVAYTYEPHLVQSANKAVDISSKSHGIANKHPFNGN